MKPGSRYVNGLLALSILVNLSGLFVTIIGPDGALYASIAKTMVQRNNYIELFAEGKDWLDKPHFPFWLTAFWFKLFGINTWAYKLPAILILFMGAWYTYALALRLYNKEVAVWSVIILLTAEHIIVSNNDVRAEPYLTGLIIASIYHFYRVCVGGRFGHLMLGALFAACAVMTKGMFALVPIGGAIVGGLAFGERWRDLFHWRWLVAGVSILVFIMPELYCLYWQFDMHPEKVVFGRTGVSGLQFFFWDSQFGRFFNTGPIKGKGDPLFFVHTMLWAFLPWSLVMFAGVWRKVVRYKRFSGVLSDGEGNFSGNNARSAKASGSLSNERTHSDEWYTISGALLCFLMFSASKFQLPHYMNIVFPLFAVVTAAYLLGLKKVTVVRTVQVVVMVLLIVLAVGLHLLFRPGRDVLAVALLVLGGVSWWAYRPVMTDVYRFLVPTVLVAVFVNFYLNWVFYPALLKYQGGSEAAFYANERYAGMPVVHTGGGYSYPLEFYLNAELITADSSVVLMGVARFSKFSGDSVSRVDSTTQQPDTDSLVNNAQVSGNNSQSGESRLHPDSTPGSATSQPGLHPLFADDSEASNSGKVPDNSMFFGVAQRPFLVYAPVGMMERAGWQPVQVFEHFHVSMLTLKLVNYRTRAKEVERYGLYKVQ